MIRFGYFPDFSDPTVLFCGRADDLVRFAAFLRDAAASGRRESRLADDPLFEPARRTSLVIATSDDGAGLRRIEAEPRAAFRWLLSRELAERFSELIEGVASTPGPPTSISTRQMGMTRWSSSPRASTTRRSGGRRSCGRRPAGDLRPRPRARQCKSPLAAAAPSL